MTQSIAPRESSAPSRRRHHEILDAALEAFGARGYHAVSMEDIATAVGVTKPVVYLSFASKDELFTAAVTEAGRRLADGIRHRCAQWSGMTSTCATLLESLYSVLAEDMPEAVEVIASARWVSPQAAAAGGAASAMVREELRRAIVGCLPVTSADAGTVADVLTAEAISRRTVHVRPDHAQEWGATEPSSAAVGSVTESIASRLPGLLGSSSAERVLSGG